MSKPLFINSFVVGASIAPNRICAFNADGTLRPAAAATDGLAGATDGLGGPVVGDTVDVAQGGWGEVQAGGPISPGDPLTSDANACAVKAVVAAGTTKNCIGFAQKAAVAGDIFPYLAAPHVIAAP